MKSKKQLAARRERVQANRRRVEMILGWPPTPHEKRGHIKKDGRGETRYNPDGTMSLNIGGMWATFDAADYPIIKPYTWSALINPARRRKTAYARANITYVDGGKAYQRAIYMHRLILGLRFTDDREADHRNGEGLDNRRQNLRIATRQQNARNNPKLLAAKRGSEMRQGLSHPTYRGVYYMSTFAPGEDRRLHGPAGVATRSKVYSQLFGKPPKGRPELVAIMQRFADEGLTLEESGERLGVTRERARQLFLRCGIQRRFVSRKRCRLPWEARLSARIEGAPAKVLGHFETADQAAVAWNNAAREAYGEWAHLNIVPNEAEVVRQMAEVLKEFTFYSGRSVFPWDQWLDGRIWKLTHGVDFDIDPSRLANLARPRAKTKGLGFRSRIMPATNGEPAMIVMQAYPLDESTSAEQQGAA